MKATNYTAVKQWIIASVMGIIVAVSPLYSDAADAISTELAQQLQSRSNAVISLFEAEQAAHQTISDQFALQTIQQNVSPLIDYHAITRRALGKYRKKVSPADQDALRQAFQLLLEKTYSNVLKKHYNGQAISIVINQAKPLSNDKHLVKLDVISGDKSLTIDYIFAPNQDKTLVVDIKVEGVSLVTNYRRQFAAVLKKQDATALIASLTQLANKGN